MRLNEKGIRIAKIWSKVWGETIEEDIAANGDNYEGGWDVMFQHNKIKNADDFIGVLLSAYGENAIEYVEDVCYENGFGLDDIFDFNVSFGEYLRRMSEYFDHSEK